MKNQRWKSGKVVKIPLNKGLIGYGILLDLYEVEIKNLTSSEELPIDEISQAPTLFREGVYKQTITKGVWEIIGEIELSSDQKQERTMYVQDSISGKLFLYHSQYASTGYMKECNLEDVEGLSPVTVSAENHIVDRIEAEMLGKENPWKIEIDLELYKKSLN